MSVGASVRFLTLASDFFVNRKRPARVMSRSLRPGSLADDTDMLDRRSAHAERADGLRKKFGDAAVIRSIAYNGPEKAEEE